MTLHKLFILAVVSSICLLGQSATIVSRRKFSGVGSSRRLLSLLPLQFVSGQYADDEDRIQLEILQTIFNESIYDGRIRPKPREGGPTRVAIDIYVRGISKIDEIGMEFTIDALIRERWNDPRLQYNVSHFFDRVATKNISFDFIKAHELFINKIWVPDLFFANEKSAYFHEVTVPNLMLRIYPNGDLLYSTRFSLVLSCDMDLRNYPFDTQRCIIQLGSFSFTDTSLVFTWKNNNPISVNPKLRLPKFNLTGTRSLPCNNSHYTGSFSCLKGEFAFNRELGYHLVQAYLPNILLVIASWIGFWLDIDAAPARITLGVTTLLTTTAQGTNIKTTLPPVSYTKAIDVWLGACTTFVFLALLEFALVNYMARKDRLARRAIEKQHKIELMRQQAASNALVFNPSRVASDGHIELDQSYSSIMPRSVKKQQSFILPRSNEVKDCMVVSNSIQGDTNTPWMRRSTSQPCQDCPECGEPLLYRFEAATAPQGMNSSAPAPPRVISQLATYYDDDDSSCYACVTSCCTGSKPELIDNVERITRRAHKSRSRAKCLDKLARWMFPLSYVAFIVVYAILYKVWATDVER